MYCFCFVPSPKSSDRKVNAVALTLRRGVSLVWLLVAVLALVISAGASPSKLVADKVEKLKWDTGPSKNNYAFFVNSTTNPYMIQLRKEFNLDLVISKTTSDLERVQRITAWVHRQWTHDGDCPPEKNDPIEILRKAKRGAKFSCREYSLVTVGCLMSIGIPARLVEILPKNVETGSKGNYHIVAEAYLPDQFRWVMADAQWGTVPVMNGQPLNVIEMQDAVASGKEADIQLGELNGEDAATYIRAIGHYIYFLRVSFSNRINNGKLPTTVMGRRGLMMIPIGAKLSDKFYNITKERVDVTHNINEYYGPIF